ncbi:MAG: oxidative damage protection protein [Gammaproteobacteria bacterium]|jgi:Fe-S cluster biosynthesis and repair protein YggX|nr:oxidative damage protection protein [Gammaproteobacteria bacterium]MBT4607948.1 oxidative damage protection protein [Thiotrichales bacterium]MBT3472282.1 oxidative damage protection protein [Gammaproteobacteria bacterium]MBT3966943.1 oxidative damage protection protein [Gammaproteobacteria bacterium]MBT4079889.1 oxidative damage protection protein [Gammaproteobacteria bacterium]
MSRLVQCVKLKTEAEGLERPTYPGELGQRIFDNVSAQGWQQWMQQQTMLINENRLNMAEAKSRKFLEQQMEAFFFGGGSEIPVGFTPKA